MVFHLDLWEVILAGVGVLGIPSLVAAGVMWKMSKHFRLIKDCEAMQEDCQDKVCGRFKRGEKVFENLQQQDNQATAVFIEVGYIITDLCAKANVDSSALRAQITGLAQRAGYQRLK